MPSNGSRRNIHESSTLPLYHMRAQHRHGFVCVGLVSNAFSICLPFIIKVHGFSNTQISLLATMKSVTSLLAMFAADRYYGRLGLKRESHWQCCLPRSHFLSTAPSSTPLLYCATSALSGISYAMGGMIPASAHPAVVPSETCRGAESLPPAAESLCSGSRDAAVSD